MKNIIILGIYLLICTATTVSYAQSISGKVIDKSGNPIYAATVILQKNDSTFIEAVITDENGSFSFTNIINPYRIVVQHLAFKAASCDNKSPLNPIILEDKLNELSEVVIKRDKSVFKVINNGLSIDVANSILRKEIKSYDVLKKIPGVVINNGNLEILALGNPDIYINGRKVRNLDEVKRLPVKEIDNINLITSPGAEYAATGRAALEITTLHPEDGFSFQTDAEISAGNLISHQEGIQLKWKRKRLTIGTNYSFEHPYDKYSEYAEKEILNDEPFFFLNTTKKKERKNVNSYGLNIEYELNSDHLIGAYFTGENMVGKISSNTGIDVSGASNKYQSTQQSNVSLKQSDYFFNTFYRGKLSKYFGVNAYFDYIKNKGNLDQNVFNQDSIFSTSETKHSLYAYKATLFFKKGGHQLNIGSEGNWIDGYNYSHNEGTNMKQGEIEDSEKRIAGFATYTWKSEKWSTKAGIRYEILKTQNGNVEEPADNIERTYCNWFPSLSVSNNTPIGINQQLSYAVHTSRPTFSQLSILPVYENMYSYSLGNASLQPMISHVVNYILTYKWIYLNIIYANMNNYIGHTYYTDEKQAHTVVTSFKNYNNFQQLAFVIGGQKQLFPWWDCSASLYLMKTLFKYDYLNMPIKTKLPFLTYTMNNTFSLPKNLMLYVDFEYSTKGDYLIETIYPTYKLDISFGKSWLNGNLDTRLSVTDILQSSIDKSIGRINQIKVLQKVKNEDSRKVSFNIVYRFNSFSYIKQNTSASGEERLRLKQY